MPCLSSSLVNRAEEGIIDGAQGVGIPAESMETQFLHCYAKLI